MAGLHPVVRILLGVVQGGRDELVEDPRIGRRPAAPTSSGSFPADSLVRLVGAVLAEQHDEWTEMRRYIGLDVLARSCAAENTQSLEVALTAITAESPNLGSRGDQLTHSASGRDRVRLAFDELALAI